LRLGLLKSWWWEALYFTIYLTIAANQLFMRPVTGLADNNDFPKALAYLDVCDPNHEHDVGQYVGAAYVFDARCHFDSGLVSSEKLFVRILAQTALWSGRASFSITTAGKAHLCVALAALIVLLWALHGSAPVFRFGIPPLVILIFSDVAYVAYLNSFYFDAASMVFFWLAVALAAAALMRPRVWVAIAFGIAGPLLALSKTQHVVTGFLFAGLAAWLALRGIRAGRRADFGWWAGSAVTTFAAAVLSIALVPPYYTAEPLYNLVFFSLLPNAEDQAETLTELGLPESYLRFSGTHAYSPDAGMADREWRAEFTRQISYGNLLTYYFYNPSVPLLLVRRELTLSVPQIRVDFLANYQREEGFPPYSQAHRFDWWSNLRTWLLRVFPAHIAILYGTMGIGAFSCLWRASWARRWPLYPLALVLAISGTTEFLFAVLLDTIETERHLFFFHVVTETLIVCAATVVLGVVGRLRSESQSSR
jgi:hypothetical protein